MYPAPVPLRKGHRTRVALAGEPTQAVLADLIHREILYRLPSGSAGNNLRQIARLGLARNAYPQYAFDMPLPFEVLAAGSAAFFALFFAANSCKSLADIADSKPKLSQDLLFRAAARDWSSEVEVWQGFERKAGFGGSHANRTTRNAI